MCAFLRLGDRGVPLSSGLAALLVNSRKERKDEKL